MASEALSIPTDIPWQRLGYSRDMLDRTFGGIQPPKWRSSLAIQASCIPLEETQDDYPDARIFYIKITSSITGWSPREVLEGHLLPNPIWDPWQRATWEAIAASPVLTRSYWACVSAILQVGIYPRPEAGVADDDYPFIRDFEPKKRELYETVTETKEVLGGSNNTLHTEKGLSTTKQVDARIGASYGGVGASISTHEGREESHLETSDTSTERRETAGRSTQLSQMYQLFNGYHIGTNRAVFAMFPRPHIVAESSQIEFNLINGERRLEGVQDVFLVVQVPRSLPGICVRAFLDTGHKLDPGNTLLSDQVPALVVTRRTVGGCAEFEGDRLRVVPPPIDDTPKLPPIVGEHEVSPGVPYHRRRLRDGRDWRTKIADDLNVGQADIREAVLADATSGAYAPRSFILTDSFKRLLVLDLRRTALELDTLTKFGYLSTEEEVALRRLGIRNSGDIFDPPARGEPTPLVVVVRSRLIEAAIKAAPSET